jgi:hypothetical protein
MEAMEAMEADNQAMAKLVLKIYIRVLLYVSNDLNNNKINTFLVYLNGLVTQNKARENQDDDFKSIDQIYIESIANKNLLKYKKKCKKSSEEEGTGTGDEDGKNEDGKDEDGKDEDENGDGGPEAAAKAAEAGDGDGDEDGAAGAAAEAAAKAAAKAAEVAAGDGPGGAEAAEVAKRINKPVLKKPLAQIPPFRPKKQDPLSVEPGLGPGDGPEVAKVAKVAKVEAGPEDGDGAEAKAPEVVAAPAKAEADKAEADKVEADKVEADKVKADKAKADKADKAKAEAEAKANKVEAGPEVEAEPEVVAAPKIGEDLEARKKELEEKISKINYKILNTENATEQDRLRKQQYNQSLKTIERNLATLDQLQATQKIIAKAKQLKTDTDTFKSIEAKLADPNLTEDEKIKLEATKTAILTRLRAKPTQARTPAAAPAAAPETASETAAEPRAPIEATTTTSKNVKFDPASIAIGKTRT